MEELFGGYLQTAWCIRDAIIACFIPFLKLELLCSPFSLAFFFILFAFFSFLPPTFQFSFKFLLRINILKAYGNVEVIAVKI